MIRFNIIETTGSELGYLDGTPDTVSFKRRNKQYFWAKMEMGRSTEFQVPATDHNRILLGFGNDPEEYGEIFRYPLRAQMQTSGNAITGNLAVTEFSGGMFKCVFYYETDPNLEKINGVRLADLYCSFKPIEWDTDVVPYDADDVAVPTVPLALVKYRNNWSESPTPGLQWWYAPSVSVKLYVEDLLDNLGIPYSINIPDRYRFITGSMRGGAQVAGNIAKTGMTAGTIDASLSAFFEFNQAATLAHRNALIGWTHNSCWSIRCKQDVTLTFPGNFPASYELISVKGNNIEFVTDRYLDAFGWHGQPLAGRTVNLAQGTEFFIVQEEGYPYDNSYVRGWENDVSPYSFSFIVARDGDIALGEVWQIQNNAPDMTLVEFLRSIALLTGQEMWWDETLGLCLGPQDVGQTRISIEDVAAVDSVSRSVKDWGNGRSVVIRFDSEDYVTLPLVDRYTIDNFNLEGEEEHVIKFSEGNPYSDGSGDVYLEDVSINGTEVKMTAKRPTLAISGNGEYLDRVKLYGFDANATIANASTAVVVRVLLDLDDFLRMEKDAFLVWKGVGYVWTSMTWSGGIATITLQKYT